MLNDLSRIAGNLAINTGYRANNDLKFYIFLATRIGVGVYCNQGLGILG